MRSGDIVVKTTTIISNCSAFHIDACYNDEGLKEHVLVRAEETICVIESACMFNVIGRSRSQDSCSFTGLPSFF